MGANERVAEVLEWPFNQPFLASARLRAAEEAGMSTERGGEAWHEDL